jgi:hypothetical protein
MKQIFAFPKLNAEDGDRLIRDLVRIWQFEKVLGDPDLLVKNEKVRGLYHLKIHIAWNSGGFWVMEGWADNDHGFQTLQRRVWFMMPYLSGSIGFDYSPSDIKI